MKLAHKIDMMDKLANEARKALTDLTDFTNTPVAAPPREAEKTPLPRRRPKSAVEMGGRRVPHKVRTPQPSTANPQLSAELLSKSKARHSANIKKLIEQREETMKLVLQKEKEVKSIRTHMKRLEREGKEREDFDSRLIQEYKGKVDNFEEDKQAVVAQWEARVKEIKREIEELQKLNVKYSQEKVQAQQAAAESREKYISCCAVLAKEKLLKRHNEIKTSRATQKNSKIKGQKNLQMLVYKQSINNLEQKLISEKKHSLELSSTLKELHDHNHDLKKHHAKSKLKTRLDNLRSANTPEVEFNLDALHGSPLKSWMQGEVVEDLGAISGDVLTQTESLMDKLKIESLCTLVDDIEEECEELSASHLNNEPLEQKLEDVKSKIAKVNEDEIVMTELADLKIKALEIEVEDLGNELEEKEGNLYEMEERTSELEEMEKKLREERDGLLREKEKAWFRGDGTSEVDIVKEERDAAVAQLKELKSAKGFSAKEEEFKGEIDALRATVKELEATIEAENSWREKDLKPTIARVEEEKLEMVRTIRRQSSLMEENEVRPRRRARSEASRGKGLEIASYSVAHNPSSSSSLVVLTLCSLQVEAVQKASKLDSAYEEIKKLKEEKKGFMDKLGELKKAFGSKETATKLREEGLKEEAKKLLKAKGDLVMENDRLKADMEGLKAKIEAAGAEKNAFGGKLGEIKKAFERNDSVSKMKEEGLEEEVKKLLKAKGDLVMENDRLKKEKKEKEEEEEKQKEKKNEEKWDPLTLPQREAMEVKIEELKRAVELRSKKLTLQRDAAITRVVQAEEEGKKKEEELEVTKRNLELAMGKIEEWEAWHATQEEEEEQEGEELVEGGLFSEGNVMEDEGAAVKGLLDSSSEEGSVLGSSAKQEEGKEEKKDGADDEDRLSDVD